MTILRLHMLLTLVLALLFLCDTLVAYSEFETGNTQLRDAGHKLGNWVRFDGVDCEVNVAPLGILMKGGLSEDIANKVIAARDRNARWLLCEKRQDYKYFQYTLEHRNSVGATFSYPYVGRYDRGASLQLASEYMLYYSDVRKFEFKDENGYWKMILPPYEGEMISTVPDFRFYGVPLSKPRSWWADVDLRAYGDMNMSVGSHWGHELWFSADDYRLTREITIRPEISSQSHDAHTSQTSLEPKYDMIEYNYYGDGYPSILSVSYAHMGEGELYFSVHDGLWVLEHGQYGSDGAIVSTKVLNPQVKK